MDWFTRFAIESAKELVPHRFRLFPAFRVPQFKQLYSGQSACSINSQHGMRCSISFVWRCSSTVDRFLFCANELLFASSGESIVGVI